MQHQPIGRFTCGNCNPHVKTVNYIWMYTNHITLWFLYLLMLFMVICVFNLFILSTCNQFLPPPFSSLYRIRCWLVEVIYKNVSLCIVWLKWRCTWEWDAAPVHLGLCSLNFFSCHEWLMNVCNSHVIFSFHLHVNSHVKLFSTHLTLILPVRKHTFRMWHFQ